MKFTRASAYAEFFYEEATFENELFLCAESKDDPIFREVL